MSNTNNSIINVSNPDAEDRYFPALALALVDHPRGTLQDLAKAIGVSKATLYRFCRTREELVERLISHVGKLFLQAIVNARLDDGSPQEALKRLISNHLDNKEFTIFLIYNWRPEIISESNPDKNWLEGQRQMDMFFLKGQKNGDFRIDMSASAITDTFCSLLGGLTDSEQRGRIPRVGLAQLIEDVLTRGIAVELQDQKPPKS